MFSFHNPVDAPRLFVDGDGGHHSLTKRQKMIITEKKCPASVSADFLINFMNEFLFDLQKQTGHGTVTIRSAFSSLALYSALPSSFAADMSAFSLYS